MRTKLRQLFNSRWFSYSSVFLAGIIAGALIAISLSADRSTSFRREIRQGGGYRYINPLLECEGASETIGDMELRPFKHKIEALIKHANEQHQVEDVAVYFRDLNNGPVFGINSLDKFAPASLMKVPLMMTYFKFAESDPAILQQQLRMQRGGDENRIENIKGARFIRPNVSYTVQELISFMIAYSDNNAHNLLSKKISPDFLAKTYQDLGLLPPETELTDFMTVKSYASCFRILFNASYLSREFSEKALGILAESEYRNGLVAGVPPDIRVAHKFGERTFADSGTKQLHDCGIVYYPDNPYLLCIMTRGSDFNGLQETIGGISELVYKEIDSQQNQHEYLSGTSQ